MKYLHTTTGITFRLIEIKSNNAILIAEHTGTSSLMKIGEKYKCSEGELKRSFSKF